MKRIAAAAAVVLILSVSLSVFVSAATVEYVEPYTEWISDNVVIYNAPSGYDLEIEGPEVLTPGYSVPAGEDVWSISQGYLNLSLYGNSTWANAGLFSSDFAHFQYVQNIETDGVTPVYRSIFIDFPHAIDVKGGFGFFCKWDSSYALATTVEQNPLSAVNADAYLFYYTSAGNLEMMLLDEDIKTGTPVGNISQFYKHGIELKIVALMIKYTVGQDTISALPLGQYDFYSNLYLSDIVYQNEEAETSSGSSVDLSPIETQLEDIESQLGDINDALNNNPYSDEMTVPEVVNPGELVGESEAIGQLEDMADEVDGFLSSLDPTNSLFWRTVIDTLFNAAIFTPFIIMAVLFLCVRAVLGR